MVTILSEVTESSSGKTPSDQSLHDSSGDFHLISIINYTNRSDPSDSKKQIIRYIRCTSNEWIRVSNKGGIQFVFVPRGYCGIDKGSGVESSICSQSFEVVGAKDTCLTEIVLNTQSCTRNVLS